MVRRLVIMRHAKSSWKDQKLDDHERPLNNRGRRDAPIVADAIFDRVGFQNLYWLAVRRGLSRLWRGCLTGWERFHSRLDRESTMQQY